MSVAFDQQATAGHTPASHTLVIYDTNSAVDERRKTSLHVTRSCNSLLTLLTYYVYENNSNRLK